METKPNSQAQNAFLWLATVIGFIVDTVALIGIYSTFRLGDTSITGAPTVEIPKINIANIALKWRDVSFVILVYLFFGLIAYLRIRKLHLKEVKVGENTSRELKAEKLSFANYLWFDAVIFLTLLWLMVFVFPTSVLWNYFYFIVIGWLFSVAFSAIGLYVIDKYRSLGGPFIGMGIFLCGAVPLLSFILAPILNISFFSTFGMLFLASIISVIYTIAAVLALNLLHAITFGLTRAFYGIEK
jgi:hypothetical protein